MQEIQVLYWALSILFCMAMGFAVLLWCRGWRKEEREQNTNQVRALSREVARLTSAVDLLEHTSLSLQTADEQLARKLDDLQVLARKLEGALSKLPPLPAAARHGPASPTELQPRNHQAPTDGLSPPVDPYQKARELLSEGRSPVDVARALDIGTAEVRMIARMLERGPPTADKEDPEGGERE